MTATEPPHGTTGRYYREYRRGQVCPECREAFTAYKRTALSQQPGHVVEAMEQAAARCDDPSAVAMRLNVRIEMVLECWARMDILAGITDGNATKVQLPPIDGRDRAPHGTVSAARRHSRRGEAQCGPCSAARHDERRSPRAKAKAS
jgi:hypothetical protein